MSILILRKIMKYQIFSSSLICYIFFILKIDNYCDVDSPLLNRMFDYSDTTLYDVPFVPTMRLCTYASYHSKLINFTFKNNARKTPDNLL